MSTIASSSALNNAVANYAASGSTAATSAATTAANAATTAASTAIYNRVQQTMAAQNGGATKLSAALTRDQTKLSALGQLQSALAGFQSVAAGLSGDGLSSSIASAAKGVLTPSITGAVKPGTYALDVKQLAQGQFLTSDTFASNSAKLGTGASTTVKIDFGTADAAKGFTANGATSKTITIDSSNNTLDGIAAAFKAAGVDAQVIKSDSGYALSIAGQSGAANSLKISVSGDAALKDLLAYNPDGTQKLKQTSAAQNALLTVDGKDVSSATNTLDSVIDGATLTLTGKGKTTVTVAQDPAQIGANVKAFVAAYNELNKKIQTLQQGDLKGDTAVGQVASQMAQLLKTGGGSVSVAALANAGVSLDSSGSLKLDEKKLASAISADPAAVSKLFTNDGKGIADQLAAKASVLTGDSSIISKEATSVSKDITSVNAKRAVLTKALTAQANALVALYTAQANTNGTASGTSSLFDMLG